MSVLLPTEDEENVRRFLESRRFRNRTSARVYRCILRDYLHFERSENTTLPEETLRAWLKARSLHWPLHIVLHRARLVDLFLDWMTACGRIPNNPFQALRSQYGQRTAPIVRALLSPDSTAALEGLRPLPAFGSFLGPQMRAHVTLMRSLGYRYASATARLHRFDRFLQGRSDLIDHPLPTLIEAWRQAGTGVQHALEAQQCGRTLSKAARRHDPAIAVIPLDRQLQRQVRAQQRHAYIYTEEEVAKLLTTALAFPSPLSPLRPLSLYTMLVLAYCAGLRLGEIVNLTLGDVNLEEATIEIRETKFFKTRRLPLPPSVMAALKNYLEQRRKAGAPTAATAGLFWHQQPGGRYSYVTTRQLLVGVLRLSGIKPAQGRVGPRIHDLRHAMACNRMLRWYQEGINPQSHLPHLATYLGHKNINSTLVYLTITQDLLQLAGNRFREHCAHVLLTEEKPS